MKLIRTTLAVASIVGCCALAGCQCGPKAPAAAVESTDAKSVRQSDFASYGESVSPTGPTVSVAEVLGNVEKYQGQPVRVEGTISKVCLKKGCWMEMSDGSKALFVKFTCPVDGRLIPTDAPGKRVIAQGELKVTEISEDDARHIAEESGISDAEVKKIVGPQKQITLASPGAIVFN